MTIPFPQAKPLAMKDVEPIPLEKPEAVGEAVVPAAPEPQTEVQKPGEATPQAARAGEPEEDATEASVLLPAPAPEPKPAPGAAPSPLTPSGPLTTVHQHPDARAFKSEACKIERANFEPRPPVEGDGGCGFEDAVQLTTLRLSPEAGFSPEPTVTCALGEKVAEWLVKDVAPLSKTLLGAHLVKVQTGPGYSCRLRNNGETGKISEHARGNALDIAGFVLSSGETVTVADDWDKNAVEPSPKGRFLRAVHTAACQRFTTVLGPEADVHHKSHLHVDIGCHGKTCTYLICQ
ncbi:extensin family protein [Roseibium litorale]|uniref:Extensin family protein n=1 Tax=Roseibium litorale TaxID=2803841 RepID=A0ABR9CIF7_9HYPH|nr:extensin family protein [Roseibium litorale]MBD8890603.1 extensin family protein [Roseibium litorale]